MAGQACPRMVILFYMFGFLPIDHYDMQSPM
jgi:hypothetical protein